MYKFLQPDLDVLKEKLESLGTEVRAKGQDMGEATRQSSETWHDNAPFDVAKNDFERLQQRYVELAEVVRRAVVVQVQDSAETIVEIGSQVEFCDQDGNIRSVRIGSYIPQDTQSISYEAPVAKVLLGGRKGEIVEGFVVKREVEYEIRDIKRWG